MGTYTATTLHTDIITNHLQWIHMQLYKKTTAGEKSTF